MAVTYGFFDSVDGDRTYNADQISEYFLKLISNGVFATPADAMQVRAGEGMNVYVTAGWGFINCKWIKNTSNYNLTLSASDLVLKRIDRVVMRLDPTNRNIVLDIKQGTPAASPEAPELTREEGGTWELSLAQIFINANTSAITQADITDERPDAELCGFITGLIQQIDAAELFAQFTAQFNFWFDSAKQGLGTATLMQQTGSTYVTTVADEYEIPINVEGYNYALDIVNVYVNGLRLVPGVEFTINGSAEMVILAEPLDVIGTIVQVEVLKSINSQEATTIVTEVVNIENNVTEITNEITEITQDITEISNNVTEVTQEVTEITNEITEITQEVTEITNNITEIQGDITEIVDEKLDGLSFMKLTQAEYDEIDTPDPDTVYIIVSATTEVGD